MVTLWTALPSMERAVCTTGRKTVGTLVRCVSCDGRNKNAVLLERSDFAVLLVSQPTGCSLLSVTKKTRLGEEPLAHPERTHYATTFESMAVVESDGKVTAVGTWGKPEDTVIVSAFNDKLWGVMGFSVLANGPGPALDFIVEAPSVQRMSTATCCSIPAQVTEGQQVKFRLLRRDAQHSDMTRRSSGTRYTIFFGSGVPNDANPAQIIGYGQSINPATLKVDDEHGVILAPASIGNLNYFTVLVFARNG